MPATKEQPEAIRAVASVRESRWTGRRVRVCRYDACWPEGRVDFDVDLVKSMYRGSPADFEAIRTTVHAECPEVGTGSWVDRQGRVVDGPDPEEPAGLKSGRGRPMPYQSTANPSSAVHRTTDQMWRLGPGIAGVVIGILLLTRATGIDALGLLGALCVLLGLASLVSLQLGRRH